MLANTCELNVHVKHTTGTARLINESSVGGQVFIQIEGPSLVGGSSAFKNYWWTVEGSFNGAPCVQ